jgi:hypothetical protein
MLPVKPHDAILYLYTDVLERRGIEHFLHLALWPLGCGPSHQRAGENLEELLWVMFSS